MAKLVTNNDEVTELGLYLDVDANTIERIKNSKWKSDLDILEGFFFLSFFFFFGEGMTTLPLPEAFLLFYLTHTFVRKRENCNQESRSPCVCVCVCVRGTPPQPHCPVFAVVLFSFGDCAKSIYGLST